MKNDEDYSEQHKKSSDKIMNSSDILFKMLSEEFLELLKK